MILVAVGEDHGPEPLPVLAKIGEIGDDVVHPGHLVVGKEEAAIHGHDVVSRFHQHHVEADLAEAAQGNQADGGFGGDVDRDRLGSVKGTHGGAVILPPRRAGAKKRGARSRYASVRSARRAGGGRRGRAPQTTPSRSPRGHSWPATRL